MYKKFKDAARGINIPGMLRSLFLPGICFILACNESLPSRVIPETTLEIHSFTVSQGLDASGRFVMPMRISIRNVYDETFEDSVRVYGQIHAWWKRRPEVDATLRVGNGNLAPQSKIQNGILKLDPGEDIFVDHLWYFFTDDREDILDKLDYSQNDIRGNFIYAEPDTFIFDAVIKLYGQLGPLFAQPVKFEVTGIKRFN